VTVARALSDTFSGISPADAPAFIASQFAGAGAALSVALFFGWEATSVEEPSLSGNLETGQEL
jgi:hypothetical protein